jgi:hypothetical protein
MIYFIVYLNKINHIVYHNIFRKNFYKTNINLYKFIVIQLKIQLK